MPKRPVTFRRLALLYPFRTREGRAARAAFFGCSGVTVLALGASVSQQLSDEANKTTYLNGFLIVGGLSAALTLILRFLAVAIEENAATAAQGDPGEGSPAECSCSIASSAGRPRWSGPSSTPAWWASSCTCNGTCRTS